MFGSAKVLNRTLTLKFGQTELNRFHRLENNDRNYFYDKNETKIIQFFKRRLRIALSRIRSGSCSFSKEILLFLHESTRELSSYARL